MNFSSVFKTADQSKPPEVQQAQAAAARAGSQTQPGGKSEAKIKAYFTALGIADADIIPKVTVRTFNQWKQAGRIVKKGEHGCALSAFPKVQIQDPATGQTKTITKPIFWRCFHLSQTEELK
jgi:hypothetical protein